MKNKQSGIWTKWIELLVAVPILGLPCSLMVPTIAQKSNPLIAILPLISYYGFFAVLQVVGTKGKPQTKHLILFYALAILFLTLAVILVIYLLHVADDELSPVMSGIDLIPILCASWFSGIFLSWGLFFLISGWRTRKFKSHIKQKVNQDNSKSSH